MVMRPSCSLPIRSAVLALSALLVTAVACCAQSDEAPAAGTPAATPALPHAPSVRPSPLRLRPTTPVASMTARWSVNRTEGAPADAGATTPLETRSRTQRMELAFAAEMREEALTSRRAALYASIPQDLPQLLEDDYIRDQRSRVAQSVIGDAVEAAVSEGFFGGKHTQQAVTFRPVFATAEHGFKIDASPSWSYRVRSERSGLKVDVPLIPGSLRVNAYRDLSISDRAPMRLGGGILIDPFDSEVRAGISLQF